MKTIQVNQDSRKDIFRFEELNKMSDEVNVKVICDVNCNNAPKKALLKDLMIALVNDDVATFLDWLHDDITWEIVGDRIFESKNVIEEEFQKINDLNIEILNIHHIITHGNVASLNGFIQLADKKTIHFCNVYQFGGFGKKAKIKEITSYIIQ